jgi:hypothetical protein
MRQAYIQADGLPVEASLLAAAALGAAVLAMSHARRGPERRGPVRPEGTLTIQEACNLHGLRGRSHMTVRRNLEPVRAGWWFEEGSKKRNWVVLYDAEGVRSIARCLATGEPSPYRTRGRQPRQVRPRSKVPYGPRAGWSTADELQLELSNRGTDGTILTGRWIRERLLAIGVPSERRVVTRAVQQVFPTDQAIAALTSDPFVQRRIRGW